ncbi:MAG: tetratricopeptide repeat protein [Eubacteriales bacterium]
MQGREHPMEFLDRLRSGRKKTKGEERALYHKYLHYCGILCHKEQNLLQEYSESWWSNLFAGHFYDVPSSGARLRAELDKLQIPEKPPEPTDSALLGHCYLTGIGRKQNIPQAVKLYEYHDPYLLAMCYWDGIGVEQDQFHALTLLDSAIEQGQTRLKFHYVLCSLQLLLKTNGLNRDVVKGAFLIFEEEASLGSCLASLFVGIYFSYGILVEPDPKKASDCFALASLEGYTIDQLGAKLQNLVFTLIDDYGNF